LTGATIVKKSYLEVTFRKGKSVAAYLWLPRRSGDTSARTEKLPGGLVVDFATDGRPIGIEIIAPRSVSLAGLNRIVTRVDEAAEAADLAPLGM
jgi:hypothetical protein